jgi:hypothetical protein
VADPLPAAELELRIALLPPISRGTHFGGPALHARRLVELWKVDPGVDVSLAQAFRLLDVNAVEGAIWRALGAQEYAGEPRHWTFPGIEGLLPELRELSWQDILGGTLITEAIKGVRGKRHRTVLPAELPRLKPDWELSRLTVDGRDVFIDVRIRRAPSAPVKKNWREPSSEKVLKSVMQDIERPYPPDAKPPFKEIFAALRDRLPDLPRDVARNALIKYAPRLCGRRGYRGTKSRT